MFVLRRCVAMKMARKSVNDMIMNGMEQLEGSINTTVRTVASSTALESTNSNSSGQQQQQQRSISTHHTQSSNHRFVPKESFGNYTPQVNYYSQLQASMAQDEEQDEQIMADRQAHREIVEEIKREFRGYDGGGKIDLVKDESTGIAIMCLNSPARKNALSGKMMAELSDLLTELESWEDGKAMIIYGADGFFCSGGDLNTVRKIANLKGGFGMGTLMQDNLLRLQSLPLITAAVIRGKAIGGGAEMSTACDFRLLASDAEIGFVHVKVGITTCWGGGARLVQLVGPAKALELMVSGKRLKASVAKEIGLINDILPEVHNDQDLLAAAHHWLKPHISGDRKTLKAIKAIVENARYLPLREALKVEATYYSQVWGGPAQLKALEQNVKHRDNN